MRRDEAQPEDAATGPVATAEDLGGEDTFEAELVALYAADRETQLVPGQRFAEKYRVEALVGEGGMGRLYRVSHVVTGGTLAIKVLAAQVGAKARTRFEVEARNAASLAHPNTVRVFDCGVAQGLHYLVMEFVDGISLDALVARDGPLPWQRVVPILIQICRALWEAHESPARIVHRDIKPANILLTSLPGAEDFVKVTDFGISRALSGGGVDTRGVLGSPQTMAPEQWNGLAVGPAADLYGLGCTAYHLLTGAPVFSADTMAALAHLHVNVAPPPLAARVGTDTPPALCAWVERMMAKAPEARFPSARAALAELERLSATAGLSAPRLPDGAATRANARVAPVAPAAVRSAPPPLRRWGVVLGIALLLAGVSVGGWLWLKPSPPSADPRPAPVQTPALTALPQPVPLQTPTPTDESAPAVFDFAAEPLKASPFRRPCVPQRGQCSSEALRAWCDRKGELVACCTPGLVPVGARGMCACAPGGVADLELQGRGCPASRIADPQAALGQGVARIMPQWRLCFEEALVVTPGVAGHVLLSFAIGPEGEVYDGRIEEGNLPNLEAQRCFLEVLDAARFAPPVDGWIQVRYPVVLNARQEDE